MGEYSAGEVVALFPSFKVTPHTYDFFNPSKLLYRLLERSGNARLAEEARKSILRPAIVAAVPFAYVSPFLAVPPGEIEGALKCMAEGAFEEQVEDIACLYFSESEEAAVSACSKSGYRIIKLEANAIIKINPSWTTIDDYFLALGRSSRKKRHENNFFRKSGYRVFWHTTMNDHLIKTSVELEFNFLLRKNAMVRRSELQAWYEIISKEFHGNYQLLHVQNPAGITVCSALFLRDGNELIGKALGLAEERNDFIYFNGAYYEPIKLAIEQGFKAIDYGPSAGKAKRLRGASPQAIWGAFKLGTNHPLWSRWDEVADALSSLFKNTWNGCNEV